MPALQVAFFRFNFYNIMKLHLPTRLRAAVLACFAVVTSFASTLATGVLSGGAFAVSLAAVSTLAVSEQAQALSATTVAGFDTGTDYTGTGFTYTAETGLLSGAGLANDITFDLKYGALQPSQWFIYTDSGSAQWGLGTTADGNIRGYWNNTSGGQITEWNNVNNPTCLLENVSSLAAGGAETVQLTAEMSGSGVALAAGGSVAIGTSGNLFNCSTLKAGSATPDNSYIDKSVITRLYVADTAGTYTRYTQGAFGVVLAADTHVNATAGRVVLNGGASGSAATTSATRNPIFVGGAGQLFLQAWGQGAINLDNDIYLGASTHSDVASYGVIRFGNDGGADKPIALNGTITVLEDTSLRTNGGDAININGAITDKKYINGLTSTGGKTLTIGGRGYTLSGRVDVSNVVLLAATGVNFGGEVAVGDLTLNGDSSATFSGSDARLGALSTAAASTLTVAEGGNLTLGGTVELGSAIVNNGTLAFASDVQLNLSGLTAVDGVYTLFTGNEVASFAGLSADNITGVDTVGYDLVFNANGTISYALASTTCIYSGGTLSWDTTSASFDGNITFVNNGTVVFKGNSTVSLAENITASSVVIEEGVSVALSGSGNNLTATQLQLDGTLVLNDNALNAASRVSGAGNLHIGGEVIISDRATLSGFTNTITVLSGGVLKANGAASGNAGIFGNIYGTTGAPVIVVENGGVVDINGKADIYYKVTLKEGATYANTSSTGVEEGSRQLPVLVLEGDATITANAELGMRPSSGASGVPVLTLNGHTLTKNGSGTFFLYNTTADAGTIMVEAGTLSIRNGGTYTNTNINVGAGATLTTNGATLNGTVTVGNGATFQANGGTYTGTSVTLQEGGSLVYRTGAHSTFKAFNTTGAATFDAAGGNYNMTVTDTSVIGGRLIKTNVGGLIWSNSVELTDGIDIQQGTVTFNGAAKVSGTLTVASGATLNVGESGSVIVGNLGGFAVTTTEPVQNGLANVNYRILDNSGTSNITSVTYNGASHTLTDGNLSLSDLYYVISDTVTAGGTSATVDTDRATGFVVKNGAVLDIQGDAGSALNVHKIVTTTSGSGTMILRSSTTLKDGDATVFAGDLEIASGTQFSLGANSAGGGTTAQTASITSLNSVVLNGGTLFVRGIEGNLGSIVSKAGSTGSVLRIYDMAGADGVASGTISLENLELNADMSLHFNWKSNVDMARLTGSGNLAAQHYFRAANGDRSDCGDTVNLNISSLNGYTGAISMIGGDKGLGAAVNMNVATGASGVSMKGISISNSTLNLVVQGTSSMSEGLKLIGEDFNGVRGSTATIAIASGASFSGPVIVEGPGNTLTSSQGGMNLSQLNVAAGAALDLNGAVSALLMNQAGTVDIAGMSLTDGAVLTYGDAANLLSVTDGMLAGNVVIGTGLALTDDGVNLGLSSAIAQEKIGISNYANSALLVVGDTWHLKSVAVDPDALRRYYWEGSGQAYDGAWWSQTDDDTSTLVELPADTSNVILVYSNAGEEASPCRMTLDDNKTVAGIEVTGGYYNFTTGGNPLLTCTGNLVLGEGGHLSNSLRMEVGNVTMAANSSLSINSALTIAGGGKVTVTGAGAVINQGRGGQPQSLSTSALEITGDGSSLSIIGLANSKSATTLGSVTLGDNTTLTLKDGATDIVATATALSLGNNAAIVLEANQVLDLTAIEDMDDEDTGKFSKLLNATSGAGTLKVSMPGEFRMKSDTAVNTNLEDAQLKINSYGTGGKTLTVMENGSITLTGRLILQSTAKTLVAGGSLTADKIELGHQAAGNPGHVEMTGGSITTGGFVHRHANNTVTISGGTLDITSTTGISDGIGVTITGGTLVASDAGGWGMTSASVGGAAVSADSAGKVTMTNTTVTDDITGNDKLVLAGTVNATADATVSGASVGGITVTTTDANTLTLQDTTIGAVITNNGSLALTGTQNVTMEDTLVVTYSDGSNGYKNTSSVYTLVSGTGQTDATGASWQVNGTSIVESDFTDISFIDGILTIQESDSAGKVYYINSDTVVYTPDASCAAAEKLQLTGGTLVLNDNLNTAVTTGGIAVTGSGSVLELNAELAADKLSLEADAATVLMGDGTLNLGADTALASGITLGTETDAGWTGTVKVTGAALADADLSSLGISGSTIELDDVSGSLKGGTYGAAVVLSNGTELTLGADNDFEGGLDAAAGSLRITGKNSISTLTVADGATLEFDFTGMALDTLKDMGTEPLLTVGVLNTATEAGSLNVSALLSDELLLTMAHGQTITLADITTTDATLGLGITKDGAGTPVQEVELVDANGFTYMYALVQDEQTGKTVVKLGARSRQKGWIGDETDTWKNTDTIGKYDSNWDESTGLFLGYGSGTVNIDTAGVDVSGKTVLVSATEGTTDYTFLGGTLVADRLAVNAGSLTISSEGVDIVRTVQVSDTARLTVSGGSELTVGTDMAILDEAVFTNRGTTTVIGTLSVAKNATLTNNRSLTVGRISAEEGTIHSIGRLIIGNGGGVVGALTGNGYLDNSGKLTIQSDVALEGITNTGELVVDGTLKAVTISGTGIVNAAAAELGNATVAGLYVDGAVKADNLTADNATMDSLVADKLVSLAGGTVEVTRDATLKTLMVNGRLTVGGKLTATETVNTEGEVTAAEAELTTATFDTLKVTGSVEADNLTVKQLETASLSASTLTVDGGVASIGSSVTLDSFTGLGKAKTLIQGDFTVNSTVVKGGSIEADKITVKGNAAFTDVKADALTADAVALTTGSISQLNTNVLTVNKGGLVSVKNEVKLNSLSGEGTLQVSNKLTLAEQITCSANVEAQEIELLAMGNSLDSVLADTLTLGGGVTLSTTEAVLKTNSFGALSNAGVSVVMSDTVVDSLLREESGRFSTVDYLIIDGVGTTSSFNLVDGTEWQALHLAGMNAALTVNKGGLYLSITAVTDENGDELKLTWDASDGNNTTSMESDINTGAGFYKALDYVQKVTLADERIFDLAAGDVGDAVGGNASDPEAGLLVRNLSGGGELTIRGNGAGQDVASIFNTNGTLVSAADAVGLTVDASTVNLGLPQDSTGKLVEDYSSTGPTLASLALINGARVEVQTDAEVLGDTDLADGTRLTVQAGSLLTTGMLSGTEDTVVSGAIRVSEGGVYTGSYEDADITAAGGSRLRLRLAGRSGLGLAAESGSDVTLDYASQGGSMDSLRVGEAAAMARMARMARMAAAGTTELNLLNTTVTDSGISHNTLTLAEQEGNHICKAAVTLSLGVAETARTLGTQGVPVVIDGAVDVTDSSITVNMLGSAAADGVLDISSDALTGLTLAQLVTGGQVEGNTVVLTGTPEVEALMAKYYSNARLNGNGAIVVDRTTDYYSSHLSLSGNGSAGAALADAVLVKLNPQADREEYRDMAAVLDSLDAAVMAGNSASADRLGAAVSGASVAAMGAAVAGDLERQLLAIRNRTTTMGVDQSKPNLDMPYFNAWINAEGDFRRMDEDGTAAGYELNSWGGTVGFDADVSPNLTMGLAATAMYGDFTAKSAEHAEGDLDTYYVTGFARYAAHRWSHTFVATLGMADASLKRTVTHARGSYSAEGETDAFSFGFLYEAGYVAAMNESATACLQPVFNVMLTHSALRGYDEEGSDAALAMGDVDMTTVTFGLGARVQAQVGTSLINHSSILEGRALLKLRAGDREAEASNALRALPGVTGSVTGAEMGVVGVELGVGLTVPVGSESSSIFADASLEVGGGYTNINGTVGYRINF